MTLAESTNQQQKPKCSHFQPKNFLPHHKNVSLKWCDFWCTESRGDVAGFGVLTCMEPACMNSELFHKQMGICPTKGKRI